GKRALRTPAAFAIATAASLAIAFGPPFPLVVAGAALVGWSLARAVPVEASSARPSLARSLRVLSIGLASWLLPLAAVALWRGPEDVLTRQAVFFSKAAMVTFGGAYAVLAYVNQAAVADYGWLRPGEMLDGLGLAETTPGPLILVLQ